MSSHVVMEMKISATLSQANKYIWKNPNIVEAEEPIQNMEESMLKLQMKV